MKFLFLSAIFFLIGAINCWAQTVDGIAFKDLDVEFLEIVGQEGFSSYQQTVGLDYGQKKSTSLFNPYRDTKIKDENGMDIKFRYMVEALNFMVKNGFEFVQAYTSMDDKTSVYHYILKKKKPE